MTQPLPRPAHLAESVLLANVARRFYLAGQSKTDIADALGISRFRVARLLETARDSGLVRIEITTPGHVDSELSWDLQQRYGPPNLVPRQRQFLRMVTRSNMLPVMNA